MAEHNANTCDRCVYSTRDGKGYQMCHATQARRFIDNDAPKMVCPLVTTPKKPALSKITRKEMIEDLKYLDPHAYDGDEYDTMDDEILIDLYSDVIMEVEVEAADEDEAQSKSLYILLDKIAKERAENDIKKGIIKPRSYFGKPIPEKEVQVKEKRSILTCKSRFDDIV